MKGEGKEETCRNVRIIISNFPWKEPKDHRVNRGRETLKEEWGSGDWSLSRKRHKETVGGEKGCEGGAVNVHYHE